MNKNGALIDGIVTQMHITLGTPYAGIHYMFKTLASTGLKVRISELDIALNSSKASTFTADPLLLAYQIRYSILSEDCTCYIML